MQAHDAQRLLKDACTLATQTLPEEQANWACVSNEMFPPSEDNHYRQLRIADFSDTVSALPPEELQVGLFTIPHVGQFLKHAALVHLYRGAQDQVLWRDQSCPKSF